MIEPGDGEGRAPDPVDWETARRVARFVAGRDPLADSYLAASLQTDFDTLTVRAEDLVAGYTGLRAPVTRRRGFSTGATGSSRTSPRCARSSIR